MNLNRQTWRKSRALFRGFLLSPCSYHWQPLLLFISLTYCIHLHEHTQAYTRLPHVSYMWLWHAQTVMVPSYFKFLLQSLLWQILATSISLHLSPSCSLRHRNWMDGFNMHWTDVTLDLVGSWCAQRHCESCLHHFGLIAKFWLSIYILCRKWTRCFWFIVVSFDADSLATARSHRKRGKGLLHEWEER